MAEWKSRFLSRLSGKKIKDETEGVCFEKTATVYSDSVIIDAIPQKTTLVDENDNYVRKNTKIIQVETQEKHLTRQEVVHMLKSRFKDDLSQYQTRKDQISIDDVCSEPSRSPKFTARNRYGYYPQSPDTSHPALPRKVDSKSGTIWLQCGEEIKQVKLPEDAATLGHIKLLFQDNFHSELKNYAFSADRGILLIRDPFTRAFKELNDVRHVHPGSHLKLLAPKKKPCRSPDHGKLNSSFTYDERRRSRSFNSSEIDALSKAITQKGISRTRAGSYSFHGTTKSGYIATPKRHIVSSTPKDKHTSVVPAKNFPNDVSRPSPLNRTKSPVPFSPSYGKAWQTFTHNEMSPTCHSNVGSPTPKSMPNGVVSRLDSNEVRKPSRGAAEAHPNSLAGLPEEALRTDSVSDVTSYDNSMDSLDAPFRPAYISSSSTNKIRSASDSGTESIIAVNCGRSSIEPNTNPPHPSLISSKETVGVLSPSKEYKEKEQECSTAESPRRSIVRPRVWVDTSHRARDESIRVKSTYLRKDVKQLRLKLKELRSQHEYNSHIFHSMISKTGKRITQAIETVVSNSQKNSNIQRQKMRDEESAYQRRSDNAEKTMRRLENEIEMLREAAVNYKSSTRQSELDEIHASLENLNRSIASLKSDFESLNKDARGVMTAEKHSLFEEERFFKEEPLRLGQLVNRSRHAIGNLLSLQKLAQQDANKVLKSPMKETDTIKRNGSYRPGAVVTQISHKTKVEYGGARTTAAYNQNNGSQASVAKTKVRFSDSAECRTYRQ
ncbi:uncharacterized protein LOC114540700 isoform X2 [Dendronephthya gigantea]|uniref:uncharacterized protein LOC114540700 isoform X2 n=1 Tax=Dendronephthya gigantea TaxID=151771 RepID=UPI00106A4244|nr:uncharacterized protein LOC114540700 isoform X2 [Dendronephthya gigantea]